MTFDDTSSRSPNGAPPPTNVVNTGPPKQKRSQIACVHCNRRRTRCDASRVGLPCSSCRDLGLTDCRFIDSKRKNKARLRKQSPPQPVEVPLSNEKGSPVAGAPSIDSNSADENPIVILGDLEDSALESNMTSPADSNESDTWLKAANVTSFGNLAGDISVAYLGRTWLIPASQQSDDAGKTMTSASFQYPWVSPSRTGTVFCTQMVANFFSTFHPIYPIIDRLDFNESLRGTTLSTLLLDTVVLAGVTHSKLSVLQAAGFTDRMEAIQYFYDKVLTCLNATHKGENIVLIQCMFILQFYWSSLSDWKDSKFWLASSIRQSQYLGLHKETEVQRLSPTKQALCRRLWWSLYIRDRQCSTALGIPVLIQDEDCDIRPPSMDDMGKDMTLDAKLCFLQLTGLMQKVRPMLRTEFGPASTRVGHSSRESLRDEVVLACERWQAQIPAQLKNPLDSQGTAVFHLHICFYTQILMFNRSISQHHDRSTSFIDINALVASHAASMITTLTAQLVDRLDSQPLPFYCIYSIFAAITVQIVERNNRNITNSVKDQQLWSNLTRFQQMGDTYPIALWTSRLFTRVIRVPDDVKLRSDMKNEFRPLKTPENVPSKAPDHFPNDVTPQTRTHLSEEMEHEFNMALDSRDLGDIGCATPGIDDLFAILDQSATGVSAEAQSQVQNNAEIGGQHFTDDWQAMYNQLGLDKIPLF